MCAETWQKAAQEEPVCADEALSELHTGRIPPL